MSDREMNLAAADRQAPRCAVCGRIKMQVSDGSASVWQCVNCGDDKPKTGQTMVLVEEPGKPTKIQFVQPGNPLPPAAAAPQAAGGTVVSKETSQPGTISISVPMSLLPDLVLFARKLKLPKTWEQAARVSDVVAFQKQLNEILGRLGQ